MLDRDIKLSNMKGLLIFLVVFGHLVSPYQEKFNGLYLFVYSFHIPLFVLVSGYFAKRANFQKICNFVLLYLIFQFLYKFYVILVNPRRDFELTYDQPYYHLWYLTSMAAWYFIAVIVNKLKLNNRNKIILIICCFVVGTLSRGVTPHLAGWLKDYGIYFESHSFSYQRTLTFLPFFMIGMFLSKEGMEKLYNSLKGRKLLPTLVMLGVFAYFVVADCKNYENILKGSYGFDEMKGNAILKIGQISFLYVIAIVMCYIVLNLVSSKMCFITKWGENTLPVFLFHRFITKIIKNIDYLYDVNKYVLLALIIMMDVLIISILSTETFTKYTYYLWNPLKTVKLICEKVRPSYNQN